MVNDAAMQASWRREMASVVESTDANLRRANNATIKPSAATMHTPPVRQQQVQPIGLSYGSAASELSSLLAAVQV
jgi:hypothetical protein